MNFIQNNKIISIDEILGFLTRVFNSQSNSIYLESNITMFGLPDSQNFHKKTTFTSLCWDIIKESSLDKPIIIPSFTFSWGIDKDECFSSQTRTHLGILPNYLVDNQQSMGFKRTRDPMFSVMYDKRFKFGEQPDHESFSKESIFSKMYEENTLLVNLGTKTFDPTIIHFIEQNVEQVIQYRFKKKFTGYYCNEKSHSYWYSFMRKITHNLEYDFTSVAKGMIHEGIIREFKLGNLHAWSCLSKDFCDYIESKILINPNYLLKKII